MTAAKTERIDVRGLTPSEKQKLLKEAKKSGASVSAIVLALVAKTKFPNPHPKPRAEGPRTERVDIRLTKAEKDRLTKTARELRRSASSLAQEAIESL